MAGPVINHERMKTRIETKNLPDASLVPGGAETAPLPAAPLARRTGMLGRVADFGDLGLGTPLPYEPEIQAEIVAGQTEWEDIALTGVKSKKAETRQTSSTPSKSDGR